MPVQRDVVVQQMAEMEVHANEEGLIPGFNVLVNDLPIGFWNSFAEKLINAAPQAEHEKIKDRLIECAHECGYHTGYGIITSPEFNSIVMPMVTDGAKDVLRGAYAVFTAWGWAKSGIVQIKEGEKMVVRAVDYYESDGAKGDKRAFMIRGVSAAFFDLAYGQPYPNGLNTFKCEQTQGIEAGDAFGEFVVTK